MFPARKMIVLGLAVLALTQASASFIKVSGKVTDHFSGEPMKDAFVRLYKNGHVVQSGYTANTGMYTFLLDKDADYVVRFTATDRATKSFIVDTHHLPKQTNSTSFELIVEMKMLPRISSVDLSFFDLPIGIARYDARSENMEWNDRYATDLQPDLKMLMRDYEARWSQQMQLVEQR